MEYNIITIYTSEEARWKGKPVSEAILNHLHQIKLAARCIVTRGIAGCYEDGQMATMKLEILSFKMPLKIEIIIPVQDMQGVLPGIQEMLMDGIVSIRDLNVLSHKIQKNRLK